MGDLTDPQRYGDKLDNQLAKLEDAAIAEADRSVNPNELHEMDEITTLIETASNHRDKALIRFAGNPRDLDGPREERAYELAEAIAAEQGLSPGGVLQ